MISLSSSRQLPEMVDSSQEEVNGIIHLYLESRPPGSVRDTSDLISFHLSDMISSTASLADGTKEERALITAAPTLHDRDALPDPQNGNDGNDCSAQASRSATEAIRQANQQASESVRQANQSASQGIQQASQSATNAIRQAENAASQSIAQFSRSSSSISSSASSAMSSAEQAISRANNSARSAMDKASQAILQASAAVAAATGSAAAAGSSFLENAAKATQGQETIPSYSEKAATNQQVNASQTVAVTATQAAIAIVGSIIASTLITFLIYFLFQRHRKRVKERTQQNAEPWQQFNGGGGATIERKFSAASSSTAPSQFEINKETRIEIQRTPAPPTNKSPVSLSLFPKTPTSGSFPRQKQQQVRETFVPWNPRQPPPPPRVGTWLSTSPGSIHLPTSQQDRNAPLGGQLKSPHFSKHQKSLSTDLPLRDPPNRGSREWLKPAIRSTSVYPSSSTQSAIFSLPPVDLPSGPRVQSARSKERQRIREMNRQIPEYLPAEVKRQYSVSKAKVWADEESETSSRAGMESRLERDREMERDRRESRMTDGDRDGVGMRNRDMVEWSEGIRTPDTAGIISNARMLDVMRGVAVGPSRLRMEEGRQSVDR